MADARLGRAIAYEITTSSLRRKPESKVCRMLYFLNETTEFWLWILAKAGMTGTKPPICNSPGGIGRTIAKSGGLTVKADDGLCWPEGAGLG